MKTKQNSAKKTILAVAALAVVFVVLLCIYRFTAEKPNPGEKAVTIEIVHKDETVKAFKVHTDREYLGEVLADEELVEGEEGPYGLYITTADGEAADDTKQEWWCLTKGGEQVNTSADTTPIADGETYELTFTTGF